MQIFNLKSFIFFINYLPHQFRQCGEQVLFGGFLRLPIRRNRKKLPLNLLVLLLFFSTLLSAQTSDTTTYQILKTFPLQATFITTDALQQWYIATAEGQLQKYDKTGQLLFEYSNDRLGIIGLVDVTNPFNVLVYYPDLATVILLDRTLSEIKEINLFSLAIFEPQAIAIANDNNIWVFDPIAAQLKKIDREGTVLFQSKNLTQSIGISLRPTFLLERNNHLFLSDPQQGIFIFDAFGQLRQHLPILGVEQFQLLNQHFFYVQTGKNVIYRIYPNKEGIYSVTDISTILPVIEQEAMDNLDSINHISTLVLNHGKLLMLSENRVFLLRAIAK